MVLLDPGYYILLLCVASMPSHNYRYVFIKNLNFVGTSYSKINLPHCVAMQSALPGYLLNLHQKLRGRAICCFACF